MDLRLTLSLLAWLALFGIALGPVLRKGEFTDRQGWVAFAAFCLTGGILLLLSRWSSLTFPGEFNMDEGTSIAFGLKYLHDPIPWRSVDGITCGPLSSWVNLWAPLLGLNLSYFILRLTALALMCAALVATALSTREMVGPRYALLCVFPAVTLLAGTLHPDFVTSALEYLPVALASGAIYLILSDYRSPRALKVYFVGFLTGAMPFSKLQSAPSAIALFLIGAGLLFHTRRESPGNRWKHLAGLAAGGLTVPTLILGPVLFAGAGPEFVNFYLLGGASYTGAPARSTLDYLVSGNDDFGVYAIASLAATAILLAFLQWRAKRREWWVGAGLLAAYVGILLFSVLKPGFHFTHYLIFLVTPTTLILSWVLKAFLASPTAFAGPHQRSIVAVVFCAISLAQAEPMILRYAHEGAIPLEWKTDDNPVIPVLLRHATHGDSMAVWGRVARFYVLTGFRPATRFIDTAYVMDPSPKYDRHRRVYLEDVKRERPRLFVDACDEIRWPTWPAGALARHEMLPELAEWVRRDYALVAELQTHRPGVPVRVYVRKEP